MPVILDRISWNRTLFAILYISSVTPNHFLGVNPTIIETHSPRYCHKTYFKYKHYHKTYFKYFRDCVHCPPLRFRVRGWKWRRCTIDGWRGTQHDSRILFSSSPSYDFVMPSGMRSARDARTHARWMNHLIHHSAFLPPSLLASIGNASPCTRCRSPS